MSMYSICVARLNKETSATVNSTQKQELTYDSVKSVVSRRSLNWTDQLLLDGNFTEQIYTEDFGGITAAADNDIYIDEDVANVTTNTSFVSDLLEDEESGSGLITTEVTFVTNWTSGMMDGLYDISNNITDVINSTSQMLSASLFTDNDLITCEYMNGTTSSFLTEETFLEDTLDPFAKMRDYFENFLLVAETYTMTSFACLGLVFNALAIAFLTRDNRMWPMSRCLHFAFLVMEELFLAVTVAFIQFRQFVHQLPDNAEVSYYEVMNYFSTVLAVVQTVDVWMLYFVATDSYRSVCLLSRKDSTKLVKIRHAPRYLAGSIIFILAFFVAYLPPVRIAMYNLSPDHFDLCNVPFENHWDFKIGSDEVGRENIFYILYYSLAYLLISHIAPFLAIASRDKDIIDVLHETQERLDVLNTEHHQAALQQSATGLTGQSSVGMTISERSIDKLNTKVIPDTSAIHHAKWLKKIRAAAAAAEGKQIPIADDVAAVLCPALAMSVACNVYLVCAALKLVILTFKLFQFADLLIPKGAVEGFKYLNVYSNFLLILKSSLHAGVLLIYNKRLRHIIIAQVKAWIPHGLLRRSDSDEWESQVNEDQAAEAEPDAKKISLDPTED